MIPKINLDDFLYELPNEKIAVYPLEDRSQSRLIKAEKSSCELSHHNFFDLPDLLPANSEVFLNTTKVISARIPILKPSGGKGEIFLTEPISPSTDIQVSLNAQGESVWKCLIGGKRIKKGDILKPDMPLNDLNLNLTILEKQFNIGNVKLKWQPENITLSDVLEEIGKTPLPPYIKREAEQRDKQTYQTVFADIEGSVAAPTAGLHFTDELLEKLRNKGLNFNNLLLHVGLGTFKPIEADDIINHQMHSEKIYVKKETVERLFNALKNKKNIISVGTTALRTLESIYWLGAKIALGEIEKIDSDANWFEQWEPYNIGNRISTLNAFECLINYMERNNLDVVSGRTKLFIIPGYEIKTANILITNFHQPQSTLILLVAAFIGTNFWRQIYREALLNNYRFLSYGDSNLLIREIY